MHGIFRKVTASLMMPGNLFWSTSRSGLDQGSGFTGGLAAAGGFAGAAATGLGGVRVPGVPDRGLPADDGGDLGAAAASAQTGGVAPLAPGVGFCASPPLAALGGAFCSSAISVDAYGKASLYGRQKHEFLHIADKHVNREDSVLVSFARHGRCTPQSFPLGKSHTC
jgi:hypothetical protein